MAINKNGTGYTFGFAIVMVVVVGTALAATAISLKPLQQANAADKKMMDILGAIKVDAQRDNAKELFAEYVTSRVSINASGTQVALKQGEVDATDAKANKTGTRATLSAPLAPGDKSASVISMKDHGTLEKPRE